MACVVPLFSAHADLPSDKRSLRNLAWDFFPSPDGRGFKVRDLTQRTIFFGRDSRFWSGPPLCKTSLPGPICVTSACFRCRNRILYHTRNIRGVQGPSPLIVCP